MILPDATESPGNGPGWQNTRAESNPAHFSVNAAPPESPDRLVLPGQPSAKGCL
jgi:hypothetical protein